MPVKWRYLSGIRRGVFGLAVGSALSVLTAGGMVWYSGVPASGAVVSGGRVEPSCSSAHQNVVGNDDGEAGTAYGNQGVIVTNNQGTLNGTQAQVFRSLFIWFDRGNDVEVGWGTGGSPMNEPTLYAEWVRNGADSLPQWAGTISAGTAYHFEVDNAHGINIWRFYFSGETTPFNYSPKMPFNTGWPLANSEHYNTCDTLWSHFYGLQDATSLTNWQAWNMLGCWEDNASGWNIQKVSNSELYTQTSGNVC